MKNKRHKCILNIIQSQVIQTQEDLVDGLRREGFDCTQGTVSRDIRELGLVKVLDDSGVYKYAQGRKLGTSYMERLKEIFAQSVLSIEPTGHMIIVKTIPGGANAASSAIDALDFPEVLGTLAGDDTIFVALSNSADPDEIVTKFNNIARL